MFNVVQTYTQNQNKYKFDMPHKIRHFSTYLILLLKKVHKNSEFKLNLVTFAGKSKDVI